MAFTAQDVKDLREKTGCGMMDCKKALTASDGDVEKAIEFLREKGLAAAAKKSGRVAAEGVVCTMVDYEKKVGVVIEVNSETDFVGKNADFISFVEACAKTVIDENPADVEALMNCKLAGTDVTVDAALKDKILTIGENLKIRRFTRYEGNVVSYTHGGGRIGVLVKFELDGVAADKDFETFGKDIAMQIAAVSPSYICPMCGWEIDYDVEGEPDKPSDQNHGLSLTEARWNFHSFGTVAPWKVMENLKWKMENELDGRAFSIFYSEK